MLHLLHPRFVHAHSQKFLTCIFQGVKQVLVKLGDKGSALFIEGEEPIKQPVVFAEKVLDTTGAGDTFTAAFAVAFVEGKSRSECLRFAGMCTIYIIHDYAPMTMSSMILYTFPHLNF